MRLDDGQGMTLELAIDGPGQFPESGEYWDAKAGW